MRAVGIIAEYNPFHNGHKYHIEQAKALTGADYAVIVLSPDFVQRGEPAVFSKYTRTRMALLGGADLVLELPVCYAAGSAEYFARGAAALLHGTGVVDTLCFGSETPEAGLFWELASVFRNEPKPYTDALRRLLKQGFSFPAARARAASVYFSQISPCCSPHSSEDTIGATPQTAESVSEIYSEFLTSPNNILGIEYAKALQDLHSDLKILPVQRLGSGYHDTEFGNSFCSATALRQSLQMQQIRQYTPNPLHSLYSQAVQETILPDDLLPLLYQKLLASDRYDHILDISPDLSDRIRSLRYTCIGRSHAEIVSMIKSRQMTEARIRRALLHLILDLKTEQTEEFRKNGTVFYARVLGFQKNAAPLLGEIKKRGTLPLLTKPAAASGQLDLLGQQMLMQDFYASHLYRSIVSGKYHTPFRTEYEHSPIILQQSPK